MSPVLFNSTLIILANIYVDEFSTNKETSVYSNGIMQVSIFFSVNYDGDTTGIDSQIYQYVQANAAVYELKKNGNDMQILDNNKWVKSSSSNKYYHDIDNAEEMVMNQDLKVTSRVPLCCTVRDYASVMMKKDISLVASDIRVPAYFTVPVHSAGTHRWVAKLDDRMTSTKTPVTITVKDYYVTSSNFEIESLGSYGYATLRTLKYKHGVFEDTQKLRSCLNYKGILFTQTEGNAWISMMRSDKGHKAGAFLKYRELNANVAKNGYHYSWYDMNAPGLYYMDRLTSPKGWEDAQRIPSSDLDMAWNKGIPMIKIAEKKLYMYWWSMGVVDGWSKENYEMQGFLIEDVFGNRAEININWDAGDWWGSWVVSKATVKYP